MKNNLEAPDSKEDNLTPSENEQPHEPRHATIDLDKEVKKDEEPTAATETTFAPDPPKRGKFARFWQWFPDHKKVSIPLLLVLVVAILAAIPFTRYKLAGLVWKQEYHVQIIDAQTKKPVSSATVRLATLQATTDSKGEAHFKLRSGKASLETTKKYYKTDTATVLVPIFKQKQAPHQIALTATGRQVPIKVVNKVTGKPIAKATIKAAETTTLTDEKGLATIVLPADKQTVSGEVSADNYLSSKNTIQVTTQTVDANTIRLAPSGKLYFLSNKTGKIDVVKTNLDGSDRQTVLAGTGFERNNETSLLASRDWKYLLLKSVRDSSGKAKLYLLDTTTDKLTAFDEGKVTFTLIGWHNHHFLYSVERDELKAWENNRQAVKSYNAETGQLATLDQAQASGTADKYAAQTFANFYILPNTLVYTASWYYAVAPDPTIDGKVNSIRGINPNGQDKKDYKTFDPLVIYEYMPARLYAPQELYFQTHNRADNKSNFYEFEDGTVKAAGNVNRDTFEKTYPTFLISPSGKHTFWTEERDGKYSLFVGDPKGENEKQVASSSEYQAYGWYSDDYLLVSKKGSELFIMPLDGSAPLKVTDYYKPPVTFSGYGYGYGGL